MSPPAALLDEYRQSEHSRPVKRVKLQSSVDDSTTESEQSTAVRRHPLGIRPSGNAFTSNVNLKAACGSFSVLPDELLIQLLEYLDAPSLLKLGGTCRALFAFSRAEELWKTLFLESAPSSFSWHGTWRSTYLSQPQSQEPRVDCSNLFSDALHRPFFCAHVSLEPFVTNIPERNQIMRYEDLTEELVGNTPFIVTSPPHRWAAYEHWSVDYLLSKYADVPFRAESVDWPFRSYVEYMRSSSDESPLYLFDHSFAEKMQVKVPEPTKARLYERSFSELKDRIVGTHCTSVPFYYPNSEKTVKPGYRSDHDARTVAYWPPTCFGPKQDLFSVLGDQRPHHRWLIIGPARSGSTFHKDPNGTCAWNAVLRGRKYWIMFPSSSNFPPPPGVFVSEDQSEVTSPLSIAEWLLGFHAEARHTPGCIEAICEEGEMLYVPAGWYHLVVNLEESIALTQNFVPRRNLKDVLAFLRDQKDSISGFADSVEDPYGLFVEELRRKEPEALTEALEKLERDGKGKRGRWEELTGKGKEEDGESAGGFSFGFGGDDEDGEVP